MSGVPARVFPPLVFDVTHTHKQTCGGWLVQGGVCAAAYTCIEGGHMQLMWDGDLKMNTVHVFDVARAIFWAAKKADAKTSKEPGILQLLAVHGEETMLWHYTHVCVCSLEPG